MPVLNQRRGLSVHKNTPKANNNDEVQRASIILSVLVLIFSLFIIRSFYLQVIKHDYYAKKAMNLHLKEYKIPAERGVIFAKNGSANIPLVLNETKYTLFADPVYIKDVEKVARDISAIISTNSDEVRGLLQTENTRYVVIAEKLSEDQKKEIDNLNLLGVGTREEVYRAYPHGSLASQLLGFVNADGEGQYGLEQFMDKELRGQDGELKAITDAKGVPLVSNLDNVIKEPRSGHAVNLSIDVNIQRKAEEILKSRLESSKSKAGSVLVMNPNTGKIVAMAGLPSYEAGKPESVDDLSVLRDRNTGLPFEVGSIMKVLTASAAIDKGSVSARSEFYDAGYVDVGDKTVKDVVSSEGMQSVESTLVKSLNTGAVWMLKQMGGGELNSRARFTWHDYMTDHFRLGQRTGVEQAGEAAGFIPEAENRGQGIDIIYANTSFGQAIMATPLQMASALSSVLNGGTYYQPSLIDGVRDDEGVMIKREAKVLRENVVNKSVAGDIAMMTEKAANHHFPNLDRHGYTVGGKTGTAEIAKAEGGYYSDRYNGTYMGFVGGSRGAEYVIITSAIEPKIPGYAGTVGAAPIFSDMVEVLINSMGITP